MTSASQPGPRGLPRRRLLTGTIATVAAAAIGGCSDSDRSTQEQDLQQSATPTGAKVLVAYFSRAGENYFNGDRKWLETGNTEVVARLIADLIPCDLHQIEARDPYSDKYDETVARNVREQNSDARPAIANPLPDFTRYDVVLLGSPIWNVRAPMIMTTFTENQDFTGRTVHPFVTYAVSGMGTVERDYVRSCAGAKLAEGLAVRGEQADQSRPQVSDWLERIGLR